MTENIPEISEVRWLKLALLATIRQVLSSSLASFSSSSSKNSVFYENEHEDEYEKNQSSVL